MTKLHFHSYNPKEIVLFPQRIDKDIAEDDPVRIVDGIVDRLKLENFRKLYREHGRSPYHPRMMLKSILYGYMNNIYSCRKLERALKRDIHFVWRKSTERNRERLINKIKVLLEQVDEAIAQDNSDEGQGLGFTTDDLRDMADKLNAGLEAKPKPRNNEGKEEHRKMRHTQRQGQQDNRGQPQAYSLQEAGCRKTHLWGGYQAQRAKVHRARSRIRADEVRHELQTLPAFQDGQGQDGLCLLCCCLQHKETVLENQQKGQWKAFGSHEYGLPLPLDDPDNVRYNKKWNHN